MDINEMRKKYREKSITVNDNEAERVQTVGDAISLIQSHIR